MIEAELGGVDPTFRVQGRDFGPQVVVAEIGGGRRPGLPQERFAARLHFAPQPPEIGAHLFVAENRPLARQPAERLERRDAGEFVAAFRLDRAHQRLGIAVADIDEDSVQRLGLGVAEEFDRLVAFGNQPAERRIGARVAHFGAKMNDEEDLALSELVARRRAGAEGAKPGEEARRCGLPMVERPLQRRARHVLGGAELTQGFVDVHGENLKFGDDLAAAAAATQGSGQRPHKLRLAATSSATPEASVSKSAILPSACARRLPTSWRRRIDATSATGATTANRRKSFGSTAPVRA